MYTKHSSKTIAHFLGIENNGTVLYTPQASFQLHAVHKYGIAEMAYAILCVHEHFIVCTECFLVLLRLEPVLYIDTAVFDSKSYHSNLSAHWGISQGKKEAMA